MKDYEKKEIAGLPAKYRPLGAWSYVGYSILLGLPVIGLILTIIFSLSSDNINRRSFARSYLCAWIVLAVIVVVSIVVVVTTVGFDAFFETIMQMQ